MKVTLFTMPKAFEGHMDIIQRNAIKSWTLLEPRPEIIIVGRENGTEEIVAELGLEHVPEVARNEYGTPLINDIFEKAQNAATGEIICYVNADIILFQDFLDAVKTVAAAMRSFLMIGQRWDMDIDETIDFSGGWDDKLREAVETGGTLHPPTGLDYFASARGLWNDLPPFAIGRTVWDNYLIYHARATGAHVVNATEAVGIVHQNHDYSHIRNDISQTQVWKGPEAKINLELAGGYDHVFTLFDATHKLPASGPPKPALEAPYLKRRVKTAHILRPALTPLSKLMKTIARISWPARSILRKILTRRSK